MEHWIYSTLFILLRKKFQVGRFFPSAELDQLGRRADADKMANLFQCHGSWLCIHLGCWNFLIGFWNSQKGILVHISLLNQYFPGATRTGTSLFCDLANIISLFYWDNLCEVLCIILICSICPICSIGYYYYQNHLLLLYWTFELFTEHLYYLLNTSCFHVL